MAPPDLIAFHARHKLQLLAHDPCRYLLAVYRYRRASKQLAPPTRPDKFGLVLDVAPEPQPHPEPALDGAAA